MAGEKDKLSAAACNRTFRGRGESCSGKLDWPRKPSGGASGRIVAEYGFHVYDDGSMSLDDGAVRDSDLPPNRQGQGFVVQGMFH
uniref:Uncharacterized protein n=1 Tax=Romanomermis culicivorax TaxID=13658 RepID=A0A915IC98_ROMCU